MTEKQPKAWVMPKHPQVDRFYRENPNHTWQELLVFLVIAFPQVENGELLYILEGGAAVHLLNSMRKPPGDLDFVYKDDRMRAKLNQLPAKPADKWLEAFEIPSTLENIKYYFAHHQSVEFQGHEVYLPTRVALAFTKSIPYWHQPSRPQDIKDIEFLGVTQTEIDQFRAGFPTQV